MTKPLRVSLVQGATRWHDPAANREYYGALVKPLKGQSDLIVLPETFLSGFTNETLGNAETMDGTGIQWLRELAAEVGCVVTGSMVVREGDRCVNRLVWMPPFGTHAIYDKRHLFRMAKEHERYGGGDTRLFRSRQLVGVNRVGVDGNELSYAGDSGAFDFLGMPLVELGAQEQVVTVTLDRAALEAHRERFPAWMDADEFEIRV